ncbi:MAG TPA: hypothetical protein VGI75_15185 [Pirellulales bacterium]|jgi:hypothetical protein
MSIGSLGFGGIGAATPLAQGSGSDIDRSQHENSVQQGQTQSEVKAEQAEGVGKPDGDKHETEDRDADGRRLWERTVQASALPNSLVEPPVPSRDASGQCGNELDLTG